jgi:simple sugar transport system permease protein
MSLAIIELILVTIVTASMPLILAGIGELIAEKAGVLNLGVEGMMILGASLGFVTAYLTDSALLGSVVALLAGMLGAGVFGVLTIGLGANQVASGLALTILGLGSANLIGAGYVGHKREAIATLNIPMLSDLPLIGKLIFGQDPFVYLALALIAGTHWFLYYTRQGLALRAVGENHDSAFALGLKVRRIRFAAVLFGGACAGLAGGYLSLVYTPFWASNMTSGRGWIALALVVFASWKPWRILAGALLFGGASVLQLHAQAASLGLPGQLLTALPYVATIVALVVLSIKDRHAAKAPASLGQPFMGRH